MLWPYRFAGPNAHRRDRMKEAVSRSSDLAGAVPSPAGKRSANAISSALGLNADVQVASLTAGGIDPFAAAVTIAPQPRRDPLTATDELAVLASDSRAHTRTSR
jgi:hypothetical protein